jgi:hypothetical protein
MPTRRDVASKPSRAKGAADDPSLPREKDEHQAANESKAKSVSKPGGFQNDPDDATNPNEVRERHLRKLRR